MSRRHPGLGLAALALSSGLLVAAAPAGAQQLLCTPGPINSCAAFDWSFDGNDLVVRAQNLQGLANLVPGDNTGGSALFGISLSFSAPIADASGFALAAGTSSTNATIYGTPAPWRWRAVGSTQTLELLGSLDGSYIEGVDGVYRNDPFVSGTWSTTGAPLTSFVRFAIPTDGSLNLGQITGVGFVSQAANGELVGCGVSGDTFGAYNLGACTTASVVPEPTTLALSGAGLLLVGALARRRRAA